MRAARFGLLSSSSALRFTGKVLRILLEHQSYDGNDVFVLLDGLFELEDVVISAAGRAGVFTASLGACVVNGAAAGFWMKKLAGLAEDGVFRTL